MLTFVQKTFLLATLTIQFGKAVDVFCSTTIPNGIVDERACDRRVYSECSFSCNVGFYPNPEQKTVACEISGSWDERNKTSCLEFDRGLVVTLRTPYDYDQFNTVPTTQEGTPRLNHVLAYHLHFNAKFLSVDGDYALNQAYFYDYSTRTIYKDSNFSISLTGDNTMTALHIGLSKGYVRLAVDWISHNIYWTDPQYKWIMIQALLGNDTSMHRVLIHENLEGPQALALDPMEALLFWSDIGSVTKIEVSSLSGRDRKSLIASSLNYPYSLAADYVDRRLYFTDAIRNTLETVTYEGRDRKVLLNHNYKIFDIAVYKAYLYMTGDAGHTLYFLNKTNGETLHTGFSLDNEIFYGITVFAPDAQPTSGKANCSRYGCAQICVTEKDGSSCLCKDGYTINQDKKTCSLNNEYFQRGLLYSNESSICILDIRIMTTFVFQPNCVLKTIGTKYMVMDTDQRRIIIANDSSIYWIGIETFKFNRMTEPSGSISGLAWDGYDRNLYWTEMNTGIIWRLSGESQTAQVFLEGVNKPRDILILPHERLIYWISDSNGSIIESARLDLSNRQIILGTDKARDLKSLSYDPYKKRTLEHHDSTSHGGTGTSTHSSIFGIMLDYNRNIMYFDCDKYLGMFELIFTLDSSLENKTYVISCNLNGSDKYRFPLYNKTLEKIEIYKGYLLVTAKTTNGTLLLSYFINDKSLTTSGVLSGTNISAIKIYDETIRQNETGPCFNLNGDCEQICISTGKSRICECSYGFQLAGNGKSCTSDPIQDNFMLAVDSMDNKLYQISLSNQSVQGINVQDMSGVAYNPINNMVIWKTDKNHLSMMHLNGTGKTLLPVSFSDGPNSYFNQIAVDYSTGNIYYTAASCTSFFVESLWSCICVMSLNRKYRTLFTKLHVPTGLVVYPSKGLMYYIDNSTHPYIGHVSMDGNKSATLLNIDYQFPKDLTIDYKTDYLYWIDSREHSIRYCKLDGTNHNKLFQDLSLTFNGLALYQDSLFISTSGHLQIRKLKISNPDETTAFVAHAELGNIRFISIFTSKGQNKNALCSVGNGGCSTFCFPIPDGGKCGCEDGIDFREGSDTICSNVARCNDSIPNGSLPINCNLDIGSTCSYYCDDHFVKNPNISSIRCNENGQWNADVRLLCTKNNAICPDKFPGGSWDICQYRENETCNYSCVSGFQKNPNIQNGTCGPDGAWNQNTEKLCRRACDLGILNGYLTSSCTLEIGVTCAFECVSGYKVATSANTVTCGENGLWAPTDLCKVVLCPSTIPNGTVNETSCDRHIYSECPFICNKGFDPNPKYKKVFCDMDGKWDDIDKPYCIERKGLCVNFFEHGKWADDCQFNADETCAFECDGGFDKNPSITRNITCTSNGEWNSDLSLLCKENDRGLIVTLTPGYNTGQVKTVPTSQDGTPKLDYIRSLSFHTDVWFLSVDGDYILHQAYVYDRYTQAIHKDVNFSIGISGENKWTILHKGLSNDYVKLAVDWISHNIYWTDPQYKWIMVQSLVSNDTSMFRTLIDDNLNGPYALALDPIDALLFWSDIGTFTKIEVSSLSGRNRTTLISSNLLYPYSLAADYAARRIYFVDAGHQTVQTVTYEGKDRKILHRRSFTIFFDIAVFKDYLYVVDISYNGICFFNKTNGKELQKSLTKSGGNYYGITVFHPDAQPTSVTEARCMNYGCEQICVTEKDGATCFCKDGYNLNQDMRSCSMKNEFFHRGLVYSNKSSICIVDIRIITASVFNPNCVLKTNGTKFIVLDTDQRQIILANNTGIYWARVDNPVLQSLMVSSGIVSGLAWDGYDRNLYWSEEDTGIIWRLSREYGNLQVFLEGLNKPRDVLIVPHERLIYWISDRNGSTIESSKLDGSSHQIVLNSKDLVDPKSLSYDPYTKRIYFLDKAHNGRSYVFSCNLNGSNLIYFVSDEKDFDKLEIYKGYLLVTTKEYNGSLIMSYSKDIRKRTSGKFLSTGNISAMKVFDESFRQNETGPCFNFNGECEHICISNGKSRICECVLGFKLAENGKSCISDPLKDDFMLVGDSTHKNIYQISLMDQTIQGINLRGTYVKTGIAYSPVHDLVIWATDKFEISIMHLNGTGKKSFIVSNSLTRNLYLGRFAVDYSTGNIYYTAMNVATYSGLGNHVGVLSPKGKHRTLVTGLYFPQGLVVYPSRGLLFYTDNLHLGQASMDGSQSVILLNLNNEAVTELTIDYKSDYLYWINHHTNSVEYCKLDGSNHKTLTKYLGIDLQGLALYQDYLFISTSEHSQIIRMKISNPNETTEFASYAEMGRILDLNIYSSKVQNKNELCSVGNRGCSTFCFPIPAGAVCGCEDGVNFREGSTTICSNIPSCPAIHSLFIVSTDCPRVSGSSCTFTCKQGYKAMPGVDKVVCNGETYSPEYPCEEIKCPATLANGKWVNCSFSPEKSCNYTCNYGYTRNAAVMEVECQTNGKWKLASTDHLCQSVTCPKQFTLGRMLSNCTGMLGQQCDYECTGYGYKKNRNITQVECLESGIWNTDTDSLCKQITCPKEIPNGVLLNRTDGQICSAEVGIKCGFECNNGFVKLNTVQGLNCLLEGWAEDVQTLCTVPHCPDILNQIIVSSDCQRVNGSKCNFTCKQGYKRRPGVDNVLCNGETYTPENPCESPPAMTSKQQSEVHPVAIGAGVLISVIIFIVIIMLIKKRKHLIAKFAPDRISEDLIPVVDFQMNTTFGPEAESEKVQGLQS